MFFNDFWGLRALTEAKVRPYCSVVNNGHICTLLRHILSAVGFESAARVPMGFTLWSGQGQLPPWLHVTLAQLLVKTENESKGIRDASLVDRQFGK